MYEFVQLSLHIMSVKCTNLYSCLFILRLWNVRRICTAVSSYYACEMYEFVRLSLHITSVKGRICPAVSSYYVCEMYEFVQLSVHITSVKCTNLSGCFFVLCLWNVRICPAVSSYYVCEMYKRVQLSLHIISMKCTNLSSCLFILCLWNVRICPAVSSSVKCTNVWSYSIVRHFILRKLLIPLLMYPAQVIRVMSWKAECSSQVAKDSRQTSDVISVEWLNGSQFWIWSDLRYAFFWDIYSAISFLLGFSDPWRWDL